MSKSEPPIFGENGAILNKDTMQPQSDWPKPEPQSLTRKQWLSIVIVPVFVAMGIAAQTIWRLLS